MTGPEHLQNVLGRSVVTEEFLTTHEVAQIVRAPVETVRYWRHVGKGPRSVKIGRRVLYDAKDVRTWLDDLAARCDDALTDGPRRSVVSAPRVKVHEDRSCVVRGKRFWCYLQLDRGGLAWIDKHALVKAVA